MERARVLEFVCKQCNKLRKEKEIFVLQNNYICKHCRANAARKKTNLEKYGVDNPFKSEAVQEKIRATNLEKLGVDNPLKSQEVQSKIKQTLQDKYGTDTVAHIEEVQYKKKQTCIEKYGTDHPWKNKDIQEQRKQTWIQNLGVESPFLSDQVQEKCKQSIQEKYGVDNARKADEVKIKIRGTLKDRYGVENASQSEEIKEKKKQTSIQNWGTEYPAQSEIIKEKEKQVFLEKYGVDNPLKSSEIREKINQTNLQRYGGHPSNSEQVQEKRRKTNLQRYGAEEYAQSELAHQHRKSLYQYDNETFDSKPELAFYIYHKDRGNNIQRNKKPIYYTNEADSRKHAYFPDFEIDEQLYELKGDQFLNTETGLWRDPYNPENDIFYANKHKAALENNVQILYSSDYQKYLDYVESKYTKDYLNLFKAYLPFPYPNADFKLKGDFNLIQYFHKSIYSATKLGKPSPLQAWSDKQLVKKVALNRLKYVKRCKPSDIRQGFSVTRLAPRISIFRPKLAERLIQTYLKNFTTIVDPFSGFSGRLIGAFRQGRQYFGFDIHQDHVRESNEIVQYLKAEKFLSVAQEDLITAPVKTYDFNTCLFTCPPYGGKEHWNQSNDEVEKTCDEWIDLCLKKYQNCGAYLFVVDQTVKYKDFVVESFTPKNGLFKKMNEQVILISKI